MEIRTIFFLYYLSHNTYLIYAVEEAEEVVACHGTKPNVMETEEEALNPTQSSENSNTNDAQVSFFFLLNI